MGYLGAAKCCSACPLCLYAMGQSVLSWAMCAGVMCALPCVLPTVCISFVSLQGCEHTRSVMQNEFVGVCLAQTPSHVCCIMCACLPSVIP